jgi:hypothetical protein
MQLLIYVVGIGAAGVFGYLIRGMQDKSTYPKLDAESQRHLDKWSGNKKTRTWGNPSRNDQPNDWGL